MSGVAFFDFDGTLTRHDSFLTFACFSCGRGRLLWALFLSATAILRWKAGLSANSQAKETLFRHLYRGLSAIELKKAGERFADHLDEDMDQEAIRRMDYHQSRGDKVVIVSASLDFWIEPWARRHGIDMVLSTSAETDSAGRMTGRFASCNCRGAEKTRRILRTFPDVRDCDTYAYGDSTGDLEMLRLVRHPFMLDKKTGKFMPWS